MPAVIRRRDICDEGQVKPRSPRGDVDLALSREINHLAGGWSLAKDRLGLAAGLGLLLVLLDQARGRPAVALGVTALGLGLVANGLARLARLAPIQVSSGPRAAASP
jgi:hypothetical protein